MRSVSYVIFSFFLSLAMFNLACSPKDKRFQSKKYINKDKLTKDSKDGVSPTVRGGNEEAFNVNPSGINNSEIYIMVKDLEVGNLSNQSLNMKVVVRLIVNDNIHLELASIDLGTINQEKLHQLDQEIRLERAHLNKALIELSETYKNGNISLDVSLEKSEEVSQNGGNTTQQQIKLASQSIDTREIKNEKVDYTLRSAEENSKPTFTLNISIFSKGDYQITQGFVSDKGTLICELKSENSTKYNQLLEVTADSLSMLDISEARVNGDLDFSYASLQQVLLGSYYDQNSKTDIILAVDPINNAATSVTIKMENCGSYIHEKEMSAEVFTRFDTHSISLTGCCIEKSKLSSPQFMQTN